MRFSVPYLEPDLIFLKKRMYDNQIFSFRCIVHEKNFYFKKTALSKIRNALISEGMDLFREHYFDLWD